MTLRIDAKQDSEWPIVGWRAWYADMSVYDSTQHSWVDLPDRGIIAACIYYDRFTIGGTRYRMILANGDWYWRWGRTGTSTERGIWVDPPPDIPEEELKRGYWSSDLDYDLIMQKVWSSTWA